MTKVLTARTFRTAQGFQPLLLGPLEALLDRDLVGGPAVAPLSAMFARELPILTAVPGLLACIRLRAPDRTAERNGIATLIAGLWAIDAPVNLARHDDCRQDLNPLTVNELEGDTPLTVELELQIIEAEPVSACSAVAPVATSGPWSARQTVATGLRLLGLWASISV